MADFKDETGDPQRLYEAALREYAAALERMVERLRQGHALREVDSAEVERSCNRVGRKRRVLFDYLLERRR